MEQKKLDEYVSGISRSMSAMTPDELEDVAIVTSALEFSSSSPVTRKLFGTIKSYATEKLLDKRLELANTLKKMPKKVAKKPRIKHREELVR